MILTKWSSQSDHCKHKNTAVPLVVNAAWTAQTVSVLTLLEDKVIEHIQHVLCNLHLTDKHLILCDRNMYFLCLSVIVL